MFVNITETIKNINEIQVTKKKCVLSIESRYGDILATNTALVIVY